MASRYRYIRKCLSRLCRHVFVTANYSLGIRCPKCSVAPVGTVHCGDQKRWPLKEAKKIARIFRGEDPNSGTVVEDLKEVDTAA